VGRRVLVLAGVVGLALAIVLAGAAVSRAADYQDANGNVCEGTFSTPGCAQWGSHVTGSDNVAMGNSMMNALTTGYDNVALDDGALSSDTTGIQNDATGFGAMFSNAGEYHQRGND
jgi:hypothetical protein